MTKEELYNYYIVENHSRVETAMFFNVTENKIKHILAEYQIVKKKRGVIHPVLWSVYKHTNKINGKCYIGITNQRYVRCRWGKDGHGYSQYGQKKFWNAIKKYGWDNFAHEIIEKNIATPQEANEREKYWIKYYDSFKNGYNATEGGSGATGHIVSVEARRKLSEASKGNKNMLGKHHDENTRKLISETHKGKRNSVATEFLKKEDIQERSFKKALFHGIKVKNVVHLGTKGVLEKIICSVNLSYNMI